MQRGDMGRRGQIGRTSGGGKALGEEMCSPEDQRGQGFQGAGRLRRAGPPE